MEPSSVLQKNSEESARFIQHGIVARKSLFSPYFHRVVSTLFEDEGRTVSTTVAIPSPSDCAHHVHSPARP